jgi:hypothetical protein
MSEAESRPNSGARPQALGYVSRDASPVNTSAPVALALSLVFLVITPFTTLELLHNTISPFFYLIWLPALAVTIVSIANARRSVKRTGKGRVTTTAGITLTTLVACFGGLQVIYSSELFGEDSHAVMGRFKLCYLNLQKIGNSLYAYQSEHGRYPARLQALTTGPTALAPSDFAPPARSVKGGVPAPYIYLGPTTKPSDFDSIVVYEPLSNHARDLKGFHAMFGDGHVELITGPRVDGLMKRLSGATAPVDTSLP